MASGLSLLRLIPRSAAWATIAVLVLAAVGILVAQPVVNPPTLVPSRDGNFAFLISDEPNDIGDFESLNVTISRVGLKAAGSLKRLEFMPETEFRGELSKLVCDLPEPVEVRIEVPKEARETVRSKTIQQQAVPSRMFVDGNPIPVPEGLQKIIEEIYEDLGCIPSSYLAVTDDMSGHYFRSLCRMPEDEVLPEHAQGTGYLLPEHGEGIHPIDEWDYRRQGYRKRWALLRETTAPSGGLDFAEQTLKRNRGMVLRIKRQFERIRMGQA